MDAPLSWGAATSMNPLETLFWRAEADPRLRSTLVAAEILDHAPDWDRLVAAHEWATRMVPRFRKRVVEAPLGLAHPEWTPDPDFDLGFHLRRTRLPDGGDWLDTAAQLAMAPFDRRRPPWEAVLVEGLQDGRAAYLLKLQSLLDGRHRRAAAARLAAVADAEPLPGPARAPAGERTAVLAARGARAAGRPRRRIASRRPADARPRCRTPGGDCPLRRLAATGPRR